MAQYRITLIDPEAANKKKIRVTKWLMFTVIFGVAPLFASWLVGDDPLRSLIAHGELFLIAAVLTGDAFGRVWNENATKNFWGAICVGSLALVLAYSALAFGNSSKDFVREKDKVLTPGHQIASFIDFCAALIVAFTAVRLEE